jgi:hypothetical protein
MHAGSIRFGFVFYFVCGLAGSQFLSLVGTISFWLQVLKLLGVKQVGRRLGLMLNHNPTTLTISKPAFMVYWCYLYM